MDTDERARLAGFLVQAWPKLTLLHPDGTPARVGPNGLLGQAEPDLYLALSSEVRHLTALCPQLAESRGGGAEGRPDVGLVEDALAAADGTHAEVMWALLGAAGELGDGSAPPSAGRLERLRRSEKLGPWMHRTAASMWMNMLAALTAVLVFGWAGSWPWTWDWGQAGEGDGGHIVVLKVFALWALSFLPGWLYVRFLGQRAGALWIEFVVHLHRLGWNRAGFLPRPPTDSRYFEEWVDDGGPLYDQTRNLYRQKFEAYYGREVVSRMERTNFAVRVDTMFPVFLATAIFASCWAAVLADTDFLTSPSSLWDMLRFAFLGAYAFVVQSLIRRFFQSDLKPSAYAAAVLRVVVVLLVVTALHQAIGESVSSEVEATVAFVSGIFPIIALQAIHRVAASALQVVVPQLTPDYPLNQLDGLNIWYESRLLEEGIEDMQNLVTANLVDVVLHTRVPVGRLVDWVDQAALYVHLDRVERGFAERRLARKARNQELAKERERLAAEARVLRAAGRRGVRGAAGPAGDGARGAGEGAPAPSTNGATAPSANGATAATPEPVAVAAPGAATAAPVSEAPADGGGATVAAGGTTGTATAPPGESAPDPAAGSRTGGTAATEQRSARVGGSVNHALRAGTHARVALRQLGIRTATDLLKAFPPELIDPYRPPGGGDTGRPPFAALRPRDMQQIDPDQLRTLVRVLDENTNLAPVWNWQDRGPEARKPARRPRSSRFRFPPETGGDDGGVPPGGAGNGRSPAP